MATITTKNPTDCWMDTQLNLNARDTMGTGRTLSRRRMTFSSRGPRLQFPAVPPKTDKVDPYLFVAEQERIKSDNTVTRVGRVRFAETVRCRVIDAEGGYLDDESLSLVEETDRKDATCSKKQTRGGRTLRARGGRKEESPKLKKALKQLAAVKIQAANSNGNGTCTIESLHSMMEKLQKSVAKIKRQDSYRKRANVIALMFKLAPETVRLPKWRFCNMVAIEFAKTNPGVTPFTATAIYRKLTGMNVRREFVRLEKSHRLFEDMAQNLMNNVLGDSATKNLQK